MIEPTSYQAMGWIAVALVALIAGINQAIKLVDRLKGKPPVEELKLVVDSIERRLTAQDEMLETVRANVQSGQENAQRENDERRRAIYEKIEAVRLELARDIKQVDARIGSLPNELIVLLRNTGAIGGRHPR